MDARTTERLKRLGLAAKLAEEAAADARDRRNAAIAEADDEGAELRAIARVVDLSPAQVQRVLVAATADRQHDTLEPAGDDE